MGTFPRLPEIQKKHMFLLDNPLKHDYDRKEFISGARGSVYPG